MDIFFEIGLLIILAGVGAYLAKLVRQPLIPAYIIVGILIGPMLGIVTDSELILKLSEIGIAFLLFMVGLEMELKKIKDLGRISFITGALQVLVSFGAGYGAARLLSFTAIEAVYVGIVVAFSSTMVVIKLLSDKNEISTLHGRLVIGILIIQDIFAIVALSYLTSISQMSGDAAGFSILKLAIVFLGCIVAGKFVFPKIFEFAARSQELLLCLSLSVCFLLALLFAKIGLSITIGAFVAGILLANLPYNVEIASRIKSLRDFFAILFFTSLGMRLHPGALSGLIAPILILLAIIVFLKPLFTYFIIRAAKYTSRTAFTTSISLGQISEFSLIIVAQGIAVGALQQNVLDITIVLALLTMAVTAYFLNFENRLYRHFARILARFGATRPEPAPSPESAAAAASDIILCGYDRIGYSILKKVDQMGKSAFIVDFNPSVIADLKERGIPCLYGDINDSEVFDRLDLSRVSMIISTASHYEDNLLLLRRAKARNKDLPTIVTAHKIDEALTLYKEGADYVILPHFLGGEMVSNLLPELESNRLRTMLSRQRHINDLLERKRLGHDHPTFLSARAANSA